MFRLRQFSLNKLAKNVVFRDGIDMLIEVNLFRNLMELFARYFRIYFEIYATAKRCDSARICFDYFGQGKHLLFG